MSGIVLTSAVRTNLLALQGTADLQAKVQERLATGKKVNSALDNATSFYTASSLNRRAGDLSSLLDGMSSGIKTLQAADNAMSSITKVVESMQANIRQARGDKSFKGLSSSIDATAIGTTAVKKLTFSGGSVGTTAVDVDLNTADAGTTPGVVKSVDELVTAINGNGGLTGKVKASNDGGKLRIDNLSTEDLSVVGATASAVNGGTGSSNTQTIGGNSVRKNLQSQFNDLRTQLDKLANDASFNGINLLKGDLLKLNFNEVGTSSIQIQAKDSAGNPHSVNTDPNSLNITAANAAEYSSDQALDGRIDGIGTALTALQTQASSFGSTLSTVQIRQDFTKAMINTLQTGADNLTLADQNEEGANLLSLNTRQQLSQTALSLSTQAQQAVLRLFG